MDQNIWSCALSPDPSHLLNSMEPNATLPCLQRLLQLGHSSLDIVPARHSSIATQESILTCSHAKPGPSGGQGTPLRGLLQKTERSQSLGGFLDVELAGNPHP